MIKKVTIVVLLCIVTFSSNTQKVDANFCSVQNTIDAMLTYFQNKENITVLLKQIQKLSATNVKDLFQQYKNKYYTINKSTTEADDTTTTPSDPDVAKREKRAIQDRARGGVATTTTSDTTTSTTESTTETEKENENDNKFSTTTVEQQETESTTENQDEIEPSERDKAYFKEISILFGEDSADFGDGDLFNLCNMSSEFEDKYDKIISNRTRYILRLIVNNVDVRFQDKRSSLAEAVLIQNAELLASLKETESEGMKKFINVFQVYKDFYIPEMCSFQKKSDKVLAKFLNQDKAKTVLLNFQNDLISTTKSVVELMNKNKKALIDQIMIADSVNMNSLNEFLAFKSVDGLISLCDFSSNLTDAVSNFTKGNQFLLGQLKIYFYETYSKQIPTLIKTFKANNLNLLNELNQLEPYNLHELGSLYGFWDDTKIPDVCSFQRNINNVLVKVENEDYFSQMLVTLERYLRNETQKILDELEDENPISLETVYDNGQDAITYKDLKRLFLPYSLKFESVTDACYLARNASNLISEFTADNSPVVRRLFSILYDKFLEKVQTLYDTFVAENPDIIIELSNLEPNNLYQIGNSYGFLNKPNFPDLCLFQTKFDELYAAFSSDSSNFNKLVESAYNKITSLSRKFYQNAKESKKILVDKIAQSNAEFFQELDGFFLVTNEAKDTASFNLCVFQSNVTSILEKFDTNNQFLMKQILAVYYKDLVEQVALTYAEFKTENSEVLSALETVNSNLLTSLDTLYSFLFIQG